MDELVSIITPAYNAAVYIRETIQSVINQTYQNWELIVIDDCSSDETYQIVKGYCDMDSRIRLIQNEINSRVAISRNNGLKIAKGRYVAFLDSDDIWLPNKLELQIKFMNKKQCVLSYAYYISFFESITNAKKVMKAPDEMSANQLLKNTAIGCLTVVVDKLLSGDFEMPLLDHAEDMLTWYMILKKTNQKAYAVRENLAYYRLTNNSLSGNKRKSIKQQWNVYRKFLHFSFFKSSYLFLMYALHAVARRIW